MRATAGAVLAQSAVITRVAGTVDGQGGWTETTSNAGTIDCRLAVTGSPTQVDLASSRVQAIDEFTLYVAWNADVQETDRVTIDSVTFQVEGVIEGHEWAMLKPCRVTRIE